MKGHKRILLTEVRRTLEHCETVPVSNQNGKSSHAVALVSKGKV